MTYQKIVVGIDFSPGSDEALAQALLLARKSGGELILAHVVPGLDYPAPPFPSRASPHVLSELGKAFSDHIAEARPKLQALRDGLARSGASVSQIVADGFQDTTLVALAKEMGADLLAVGSNGRSRLERLVLGNVTQSVVRQAECDVLVARPREEGSIEHFGRILVPIDFAEHSRRALARATELADARCAIHALHCWHYPVPLGASFSPFAGRLTFAPQFSEELQRGAREQFVDWKADPKVSFETAEGHPALGISERGQGYDLIVMGSHGRRGFRRLLLGSVAEAVIRHAPCSVLVVR